MDRLNQLRGEAGGSRDSTLDTSSPPSEAFMTANESSSKYFSLSEVDSTFDISPIKDISLASATVESEKTIGAESDRLISNLSPIGKKSDFDTYKIGKQIEAANILSGGVDIFDDNDNSYDGDELVIDDNAEIEEKSNPDMKLADSQFKDENSTEAPLVEPDAVPSKDTEVILQIDGKNVDAIDIGNGLYLYRKEGQEELAAVQIIDDDQQQPSFKFLKVRENNEGNLEVYEEIQIEVPKEVPVKEEKVDKNISHVPIKDISKVMSDSTSNKIAERKIKTQNIPKPVVPIVNKELESETNKEPQSESKSDSNVNKKMKFSESRKSPVISSFKPMTFHSTPNKEGIPLTKTMVDQQLHPSRHSDNVKKTIEVHTDSVKQRILESPCKQSKDLCDDKEKHDSSDSSNVAPLMLENKDAKRVLFDESPNTGKNIPDEKLDEKVEKDNQTNKESLPNTECALAANNPDNSGSSSNKIVDSKDVIDSSTKEIQSIKEPEANKIVVNKDESKGVIDASVSKEQNTKEKPEDIIVLNKEDSKDVVDSSVNKELTIVKNPETNVNAVNKIIISAETDVVLDQPQENKLNLHNDELVLNKKPEVKQDAKDELSKVESSNKADNKNAGTSNPNKLEKQTVDLPGQSDNGITKKDSSNTNLNITTVKNVAETVHTEDLTNKDKILSIDTQNVEKNIVQEDKSNSTDIKKDELVSVKVSSISEEVVPLTTKEVSLVSAKEIIPLSTTKVELLSVKESTLLSAKEDSQLTTDVTRPQPKEVEKIVSKLPNPVSNKISTSESQSIEASQQVTEMSKNKNDLVSQSEKKPVTNPETKISVKIPEAPKPKESIKDIKEKNTRIEAEQKPKEVVKDKSSSTYKKDCTNLTEQKKINVETSVKPLVKTVESSTTNIAPSEAPKNASKVDTLDIKNKEDKELKKQDVKPAIQQDIKQIITHVKNDVTDKKAVPKLSTNTDQKPINNNHAPVPFGKWTDVNRQAFLNKIKESKVPTNSSNGKQIKNSNDLNRRDVLKKIDSQRQAQELANMNRLGVKKESAFTSKSSVAQDSKPTIKSEIPILKNNSAGAKKSSKQELVAKAQTATTSTSATVKKESVQRKEINNQDLIDKTIEGIINRAVPAKNPQEETNQTIKDSSSAKDNDLQPQAIDQPISQTTLDAIEMKMNELHGIPFIERPAHELPHVSKPAVKSFSKSEPTKAPVSKPNKLPNLLPYVSKVLKGVKDNVIDVDSEEEVIEHEPITGDMDLINADTSKLLGSDKCNLAETVTLISADSSKKETIITEKDFDKFVRRNSINYENCLTVNFDSNEPHHNVVQTIVQKDSTLKTYSKMDNLHSDTKLLSPRKHEPLVQNSSTSAGQLLSKFENLIGEDDCNKNYQSKVKMAYQTAMTAKRQLERPITIIEDRPVKVVFMDSNAEYISSQLNVQGQELSPAKKPSNDLTTTQASDSLDSDTLDSIEEVKVLDDTKVKTKHQRKQVLTPVETPELELIAPGDLGIEVSPKKKRRTEEKIEKSTKTLVPKKTYLLGRGNTTDESSTKSFDLTKSSQRDPPKQEDPIVSHKNTASAIDSLVKAAELLETQSASITSKSPDVPQTPDSQQNTPMKRGRGRPRKYPLPEGTPDKSKVPSPQKKPRLIDAKVVKSKDTDDDDDDESTDDEMIKENWTMGKINENIVCPICNKLFRSENVVFKHVKHCTGPSPSRSDSDNKSPRRLRDSQESDTKSFASKSSTDMDIDETITLHNVRKKRKSKDTSAKVTGDKDDVIVIEDTPVKPKIDRREEFKPADSRKTINKNKVPDKATSLVCEFCGKTFRQLSYLVNHKLQHGKEDSKKNEEDSTKTSKSVFSCETCKKEFRKLHHLVQHRIIIHNPSGIPTKMTRKSSLEQSDHKDKTSKDQNPTKQTDDPSAGFRCEPCDKSFRKLHHLVEHRETHDGINRQKYTTTTTQSTVDKLPPPPQCDICKKTFRKLHHLIEHKEQHLETSSEKSDDKSVKSCLSTKDIIHECSLCYMVFPNEHSLNKHTVFCQRKKRQSATKQLKQSEEVDKLETDKEIMNPEENKSEIDDDVTIVAEEIAVEKKSAAQEIIEIPVETNIEMNVVEEKATKPVEPKQVPTKESPKSEDDTVKQDNNKVLEIVEPKVKPIEELPNLPVKVKKIEDKEPKPKVQDASKKKTPLKEKAAPTTTKRHRPNLPPPEVTDAKPAAESSDDDEVRYMLNPDYKFEDNEGKLFMKVRANKRNSLQFERPNSKDLVKRRISLQHPPKVPRLKPKPVQNKPVPAATPKAVVKPPKLETVPSSDSDDSDVKYSFPEPTSDVPKPSKNLPETSSKESAKKTQRKSLAEKRKSLSSIAKRKSLGKAVGVKHKVKASPLKQVRKRTTEVEHRCDCGQLFSSAALLSRHTTLAHTPPRIRRRRSPPPEVSTKTIIKPQVKPRKSIAVVKTRPSADSRKSSVRSDTSNPTQPSTKRKSSIKAEPKTPTENRKSPKTSEKTESVKSATSNVKLRRYAAHKGVPVPEKMRKLMEKSKK